jgi:hypothetical protein
MSRYAYNPEHHTLLVTWPTGEGDTATILATLAPATPDKNAQHLAQTLTDLSQTLWRSYTHPPTAAESLEVNTEGWRRQGERDSFAALPEAVANPNLPHGSMLLQSYVPSEENAHRVGRALHTINDPALTKAVLAEVRAEITAIENAELGDLTGRARQAVTLTRAGASPAQVEAADRLLRTHPDGCDELFTQVDPTAAAVATAHWLHAAAEVTSLACGLPVTAVVVESDNIQALPHATPTMVLALMEEGENPYDIVTNLVRQAMELADGNLLDPGRLVLALQEAVGTDDGEKIDADTVESLVASIRLTPLDPSRPAQDLLEDLLLGIGGCATLFSEYADELDEELGGPIEVEGAPPEEDGDDPEYWDRYAGAVHERYLDLVRAEAQENRDRLL